MTATRPRLATLLALAPVGAACGALVIAAIPGAAIGCIVATAYLRVRDQGRRAQPRAARPAEL